MDIPNSLRDKAHDWASGCEVCQFGLVSSPDIVPMLNLNEGRAIQMDEELIEFCNCRAGHMYRQHLRKVLNSLSLETRRNMREFVLAARVPTVRFVAAVHEGERV